MNHTFARRREHDSHRTNRRLSRLLTRIAIVVTALAGILGSGVSPAAADITVFGPTFNPGYQIIGGWEGRGSVAFGAGCTPQSRRGYPTLTVVAPLAHGGGIWFYGEVWVRNRSNGSWARVQVTQVSFITNTTFALAPFSGAAWNSYDVVLKWAWAAPGTPWSPWISTTASYTMNSTYGGVMYPTMCTT